MSTEITPASASSADTRFAGLREFWHYFAQNRGAVIGLVVFGLLVLIAIFAPVLAPHAPEAQDKASFLLPPVWQEGGDPRYLLGTDPVGRDILSRLIHAGQGRSPA